MAENQILPFAYADGANVLSQSDYQADNQRLIGHQPGIARSALENKALRQASVLVAGLAQFIADGQADDVTDSKTPTEIAAMLLAAAAAQMPAATQSSAGKVRLATNQEAAAFSNTSLAISPMTLGAAFEMNGDANRYDAWQRFPGRQNDRRAYCYGVLNGTIPTGGQGVIYFPVAFSNIPAVLITPIIGTPTSGQMTVSDVTTSGFKVFSTSAADMGVYWCAFGVM